MKLKKAAAATSMITAASAVAAIGFSAPALASNSTTCTALPYVVIGDRTCRTGTLHSNAAHDIRIIVRSDVALGSKSPWDVWDVNTGVVVARGTKVPANIVVHGLYGVYEGRLNDAGYKDTLTLKDI